MNSQGSMTNKDRETFEKGVRKFIEKCTKGDVASLPIKIPSLRPLVLPPNTNKVGGHTMSLSERKVYGLEKLTVGKMSSAPSWIYLEFCVPEMQITAERYHLQSRFLYIFRYLNDIGSLKCDVTDLQVKAEVHFGAYKGGTAITDMKLRYWVKDIKLHLSGSSHLVTSRVRARILARIKTNELNEKIVNTVKEIAMSSLQKHTPEEYRNLLRGL